VVLSRTPEPLENSFWHKEETMLLWAENRESALFFADVVSVTQGKTDFFVIGGSEMYRVFGDLFNKIYLTEVMTGDDLRVEATDAFFEYKVDNRKWQTIKTEEVAAGPKDDYPSRFSVLERRTKYVRYVEIEDYFTEIESKRIWLQRLQKQLDLFRDSTDRDWSQPRHIPYQYQLFEEPG
jgi:dihydrofolate reductase